MAKLEKKATLVGSIVSFAMTCKRDSFAPEHTFNVEIDIKGVEMARIVPYAFGGASVRVRVQAWIRAHWTEEQFVQKSKSVLKFRFDEIDSGLVQPYGDILMTLTKEQFVERICTDLGATEDEAEALYNRKHNINPDEEE